MNDDPAPLSTSADVCLDAAEDAKENQSVHDVTITPQNQSPRAPVEDVPDSKAPYKDNPEGDSRSDSEAETVVPSGKDEISTGTNRKAFIHEGETETISEAGRNVSSDRSNDGQQKGNTNVSKDKEVNQEPISNVLAETNNSSNLSSTTSSPAHEPRSPSVNRSDSVLSRSSVHREGTSPQREVRSRKRKRHPPSNDTNETHRRSPSKQDFGTDGKDTQESQGNQSVNRQDGSADRSTSPMIGPQPPRAQSAQSSDLHASHRRKKPPPLLVSHQRKASEEAYAESDESGSVHTAVHLRRLVSVDTAAISPAKTPHKKLRDKNGRTLLARACAGEEVDPVKLRLQERPQDLDIADNAGNSPLQIASLEGNASIVEVLLAAGCDITCKNIDSDTPLIDAVENGHLDVVRLLLKAGLDPRQSNAKGEEPLDLLDPNDDNYEDIRSALIEAKGNDTRRRYSEDQNGQASAGRESISAQSPHGSPPLASARSPPSHAPRRRTARSEATRNDLLWINPSPENLRDRAGKGDVEGVIYILDMCPTADIEAVLAAARGGHKVVLELLLAMGEPEPDPDPLQSTGYKAGYNTPMLAAIGRGNTGVITLLLSKPGFNPTRRLYKNLAYHEIAKERQGLNWEEEYDILKNAFDNYTDRNATNESTEQARSGSSGHEVKRSRRSTLTSTMSEPTNQKGLEPVLNEGRTKRGRPPERKGDAINQEHAHPEPIQHSSRKHLQVPTNSSRDSSVVVSDRENTTLGSPTNLKTKRSSSDVGVNTQLEKRLHKPRRKLVSGKVFRNDQEKKRRASLMSEASSSSSQNQDSIKVEDVSKITDTGRDLLNHHTDAPRHDSLKKRSHRSSSSPRDGEGPSRRASDIPKKKKRRRLDPESESTRQESDRPPQPGSAAVANMISTTQSLDSAPPQGAAPVAFMGNSNASTISSPTNTSLTRTGPRPPATSNDQVAQRSNYLQDLRDQTPAEELLLRQQRLGQESEQPTIQDPSQEQLLKENQERQQREQETLEQQAIEKAAHDEAERESRIAREQEEARVEERRRLEEAERNARLEREAEEARIERKRREDEMQKRRAEAERIQREDQERRRAEKEEHERVMRLRRLEEEERRRREALPNGLRRAAELKSEDARAFSEIVKWLPTFTVTSQQLDPDCSEEVKDEKWISNVQAAPILAVTDLDLAQCESIPTYSCCYF